MRKFELKRQLGKQNLRWDGNIRFDDFYIRNVHLDIIKVFFTKECRSVCLKTI